MLVKFSRAHWYQGERTKDEDHNGRYAIRKGRIDVGAVKDIPTAYFDKYLDPHGFAAPHNVEMTEAKELIAGLKTATVQQLRDLADEHELEVEGTGSGGRLTKKDLITVLSKAGVGLPEDGED